MTATAFRTLSSQHSAALSIGTLTPSTTDHGIKFQHKCKKESKGEAGVVGVCSAADGVSAAASVQQLGAVRVTVSDLLASAALGCPVGPQGACGQHCSCCRSRVLRRGPL